MTEKEIEDIKQQLNQIMIAHQNAGTDFHEDPEFILLFSKISNEKWSRQIDYSAN